MANVDNPSGFTLISGPAETLSVSIDASNATTIGQGDPLTMEADGGYARSATGAGATVAYIAQGFKNSNGESVNLLPALTAGKVTAIKIVAGQIWKVQCDSGTAVAATAVNATADIVAGNASTTSGRSVYELDSDNIGTGQQCRILGLYEVQGNSWAEHADVLIEFSENASTSNTSV